MVDFVILALLSLPAPSEPKAILGQLEKNFSISVAGQLAAGRYELPGSELLKFLGGGSLSGSELHLFSDGSYIYCEWADIEPRTIYDKGRWSFSAGFLELSSDPDIVWNPRFERRLVALRRKEHDQEVLLVGELKLEELEKELLESDGSDFTLVLGAYAFEKQYSKQAGENMKSELMSSSWKPEYFRAAAPNQ